MKELKETIQDLKVKKEKRKKSQRETTQEIEHLGKKSGVIDTSTTNRIQEREDRISGAEDSIENINKTVKEILKCKNVPNLIHAGNPGQNEKTKPKVNR